MTSQNPTMKNGNPTQTTKQTRTSSCPNFRSLSCRLGRTAVILIHFNL
jgi:hypothetical protein